MGGRSRAAAQLLAGKGFKDVYDLKGGIAAWQGFRATGPKEMGMSVLKGNETPTEIIIIAYGMEQGLGELYSTLAGILDDQEVVSQLKNLAVIEERHKERLFNLYLDINKTTEDQEAFEANTVSQLMEGGFTTQEFLDQNSPVMQTVPDVLNIAIMLETQALDLYLRYSDKIQDKKSREVLYIIAQEEKAHMEALGRLRDERS